MYIVTREKMIAIRYEHIRTVQHNIGNGVTEPKFATTDDNTPVIVKTFNGPEGSLVLFNEYFCYRLAILLNIPMPISGVCLIDKNTEIFNDCVNENQLGLGFYSTYLNKSVTLVNPIIKLMKNKEDFFKVLLFDHIIFNTDRNPGNLLVQYYKNDISLKVIDHSHVFINQAIWDANCLTRAINDRDYFSTRILEDNSYLYSMFFHNMSVTNEVLKKNALIFHDIVTESNLRNILLDIPQEWLPSQRDLDALVKYILYRVNHIEDICTTIINFLKK